MENHSWKYEVVCCREFKTNQQSQETSQTRTDVRLISSEDVASREGLQKCLSGEGARLYNNTMRSTTIRIAIKTPHIAIMINFFLLALL